MSEHDSHEDPALSNLYRRTAGVEPPASLDERVMATLRRHTRQRGHRWWLPLSTAAVMVLAVSLLLRHQSAPDELQRELAELEFAPAASAPPPPLEPERKPAEAPRREAATVAQPAPAAKAKPSVPSPQPLRAETKSVGEPPPQAAPEPAAGLAPAPAADMAETTQADVAAARSFPGARLEVEKRREAKPEAPEPWLKRIETLRDKGETEAARRELEAFRKHYPAWPLPKELLPLLRESDK